MASEQKYGEVLKELGALLAEKNATISNLKWQIDKLKEKLEAAEAERDKIAEDRDSWRNAWGAAAAELEAAIDEIDELKGGAA